LSTFISFMHMILRDTLIPYVHIAFEIGSKITCFKQVTRKGIFDSSSECLENMG